MIGRRCEGQQREIRSVHDHDQDGPTKDRIEQPARILALDDSTDIQRPPLVGHDRRLSRKGRQTGPPFGRRSSSQRFLDRLARTCDPPNVCQRFDRSPPPIAFAAARFPVKAALFQSPDSAFPLNQVALYRQVQYFIGALIDLQHRVGRDIAFRPLNRRHSPRAGHLKGRRAEVGLRAEPHPASDIRSKGRAAPSPREPTSIRRRRDAS
jgi:hypothetical protein